MTPPPSGAGKRALHPPRILILTGDIDGNLGDRAILQATCGRLRSIHADITIVVQSSDPGRLDVDATVIERGLRGFPGWCLAAARSDIVFCGGGGLFQDDDSLLKMPYWAARVLIARLLCGRVVGYSLGVGPLESRIGRRAASLAFAAMERISVRDHIAYDTAQGLTRKPITIVPDPALLLPAVTRNTALEWMASQGVPASPSYLVGVAVRRWFRPHSRVVPHKISSRFMPGRLELSPESSHLSRLLARVLDELIRRHCAHVLLMPSYPAAHEGDVAMANAVMSQMTERAVQLLDVDDASLYKGIASCLDLFIGGRMHPTILAAAGGTPVVGLAYNPKFHGFFRLLGQGDRVMDVQDFVGRERIAELVELSSRALLGPRIPDDTIASLGERIDAFQTEVLESIA